MSIHVVVVTGDCTALATCVVANHLQRNMAADIAATTTKDPLDVKDCPVDKALGTDDPNNVFTCKKAEECCTVDLKPACCAKQDITEEL